MKTEILLERDMLYPTDNYNEPGSVHIRIYNPNSDARIPAVIESKSGHSPLKFLDSIIRLMQSDIFDRVFIDIKKNVDIYIRAEAEQSDEFGGKALVKVCHEGEKIVCRGVEDID